MDSDNTLLNYSRSECYALKKTLKNYKIKPTKKIVELYRQINNEIWQKHEKGEIKKADIGALRFTALFKALNSAINPEEFNFKYMDTLANTRYTVKGAISTLKKLTRMGVKIYLVTNGTDWVQNRRISSSKIKNCLSGVFVSEKAGYSKPDPRYFDYCFEQIGKIDKSKILLVGDSPTADILGAINIGVDSCHFSPSKSFDSRATYKITRLSSLINIVK